MAVTPDFGVFPLGSHVYREPHQDEDELYRDIATLKRHGFNMIKIQESWSANEMRPGEYDFSRIERLMTRARDLDLGVYLGLTMEQAPAWLWREHPDCAMVYADGRPVNDPTQFLLPADAKPGPCWDHPGARAAGERFIAELARRLGAFHNLWTWNTWQEIGFWPNDGGPLGLCFCSHTLDGFRDWLRTRYGDLASLNQAWYTGYGEWAEVEPPRRFAFNAPFTDWRWYMDNVYLSRALAWKTAALRANDPAKRPIFSHVASPRIGATSEWRWAREGDFFGNSNYPAWTVRDAWDAVDIASSWHDTAITEVWYSLMLRSDLCRAATGRGRAFWGAEFQGGPISGHLHLGRTPDAADIRRWMLAGLAAGMHGISFWNVRAERSWQEANGFGLLDPDGDSTERLEEAGRVGRAIAAEWELFAHGEAPRAQVALLVNDDLFHFAQGTETGADRVLPYNIRGHYARLWRLGVPVDFVNEEEVLAGALAEYRAAILSAPLLLDDPYFATIGEWVAAGGTLISDACPGRFDRYGFCRRAQLAPGAELLFGARHESVRIVREPDGCDRWTPRERGWGEFAAATTLQGIGLLVGASLPAAFYLQTLQPIAGEAILTAENQVAGVHNRHGEGSALLLGTFTGMSATAERPPHGDDLVLRLLQNAGVAPDRVGSLLRRRRVLGESEAWFLINPGVDWAEETLDLGEGLQFSDLLGGEVLRPTAGPARISVEPAGIRCLVLRRAGSESS